ELLEIRLVVEHEEIAAASKADRLIHLVGEAFHHADAQLRELDIDGRRELVANAAGIEARGAQTEHLAAFHDEHVRASTLGEVVRGARAHDSAADDDDVGCPLHRGVLASSSARYGARMKWKASTAPTAHRSARRMIHRATLK